MAIQTSESYKSQSKLPSAAGKNRTTSLAIFLECTNIDMYHTLATPVCFGVDNTFSERTEEGMQCAWKFTMARKFSVGRFGYVVAEV